MPGKALLRGAWAGWQSDLANRPCCDISDSQPYFYSSINLIGKKEKRKKEPWSRGAMEASHRQEISKLLPGTTLVEHTLMTIIYFGCRPGPRFSSAEDPSTKMRRSLGKKERVKERKNGERGERCEAITMLC